MNSPLKGAQGHILAIISTKIAAGNPCISLLSIAVESGYSLTTVQHAVKALKDQHYILVSPGGPRRPARYALVDEQRRRTLNVAHLVGLIA